MIYVGANLKAKSEVIALTNQTRQDRHQISRRIVLALLFLTLTQILCVGDLRPEQRTNTGINGTAAIDPRSKTPAIAGGNKGPAGEPSCNTQAVSGFEFEVCQYGGPAHQTAQQWLDSNGFAGTVKDNNTIVIDGVIDITHETSQAPNPKFRWI